MKSEDISARIPDADMGDGFRELLTIDEVAALLKVPKSWIYERTRKRGPWSIPFHQARKISAIRREGNSELPDETPQRRVAVNGV